MDIHRHVFEYTDLVRFIGIVYEKKNKIPTIENIGQFNINVIFSDVEHDITMSIKENEPGLYDLYKSYFLADYFKKFS